MFSFGRFESLQQPLNCESTRIKIASGTKYSGLSNRVVVFFAGEGKPVCYIQVFSEVIAPSIIRFLKWLLPIKIARVMYFAIGKSFTLNSPIWYLY